ncbi:unnamed protein product, partial [Ectocarpus fasciculatus]
TARATLAVCSRTALALIVPPLLRTAAPPPLPVVAPECLCCSLAVRYWCWCRCWCWCRWCFHSRCRRAHDVDGRHGRVEVAAAGPPDAVHVYRPRHPLVVLLVVHDTVGDAPERADAAPEVVRQLRVLRRLQAQLVGRGSPQASAEPGAV